MASFIATKTFRLMRCSSFCEIFGAPVDISPRSVGDDQPSGDLQHPETQPEEMQESVADTFGDEENEEDKDGRLDRHLFAPLGRPALGETREERQRCQRIDEGNKAAKVSPASDSQCTLASNHSAGRSGNPKHCDLRASTSWVRLCS